MPQPGAGRTKVFISYSHKDEQWLHELKTHLRPIERLHGIDVWDDKKIAPGMTWHEEIRKALATARVAVLLVTKDFLASEFIDKEEVPPLLEAAHRDGVTIMPVIVKPSYFRDVEVLSRYQAANDPERPLIELSEAERDRQFVEIVRSISQIMRGQGGAVAQGAAPAAPERVSRPPEPGAGDDSVPSPEQAIEEILTAMFADPAQQGLFIEAMQGDSGVELLLIAEGADGTVICEIATNDDLPPELQLSPEVQRSLVEELGFTAPEQRGDRFWCDLGPIGSIDVPALSGNIVELLDKAFGVPSEQFDIGWQVMQK